MAQRYLKDTTNGRVWLYTSYLAKLTRMTPIPAEVGKKALESQLRAESHRTPKLGIEDVDAPGEVQERTPIVSSVDPDNSVDLSGVSASAVDGVTQDNPTPAIPAGLPTQGATPVALPVDALDD